MESNKNFNLYIVFLVLEKATMVNGGVAVDRVSNWVKLNTENPEIAFKVAKKEHLKRCPEHSDYEFTPLCKCVQLKKADINEKGEVTDLWITDIF